MLSIKALAKTYKHKQVLSDINFSLAKGEILGIVGESGSGKSTLARILAHLESSDSGEIYFNGANVTHLPRADLRKFYQQVQMIFQSPANAFDPRQKLGKAIAEILRNNGRNEAEANKLWQIVGLDASFANRYPHEVSGGQCQRVAIARAIAINPSLLICDEITSALDIKSQEQIINLLRELQAKLQLSLIFISHDLKLVESFCDNILVMHEGKIVERGTAKQIIQSPQNEYTKLLIDAIL